MLNIYSVYISISLNLEVNVKRQEVTVKVSEQVCKYPMLVEISTSGIHWSHSLESFNKGVKYTLFPN